MEMKQNKLKRISELIEELFLNKYVDCVNLIIMNERIAIISHLIWNCVDKMKWI